MSWFLMKTSKDKFSDEATYPVYADFVDASGIRWKTRVQINGIDVGKIGGIEHLRLDNGRLVARVTVRILNDYTVYQDAAIKKAAESLLGDFRLDLDPGNRGAAHERKRLITRGANRAITGATFRNRRPADRTEP